jgi:VNT family MFS transporter (synaptic vesicle glycoprotein 2)
MICSIPSFVVAGLMFLLPESPKFLLAHGKPHRALQVFRYIYSKNTGRPEDTYPVSLIFH